MILVRGKDGTLINGLVKGGVKMTGGQNLLKKQTNTKKT